MMALNPRASFLKANFDLLRGRLHFPRQRIGERITTQGGRQYTVFRQAYVDPGKGAPESPGAIFTVWFHPAGLPGAANKCFSILPLPFCVGCPGFRSKLWTVDESTGECAGIYEWDSLQDAQNYANSYAMKFSKKRSKPGTFKYKIEAAKT